MILRLLYSEKHICCFITSGGAVDEGAAGLWQPFHSKVHGGWQPGTQRADSIILHYFSLSFHSFFPFLFFKGKQAMLGYQSCEQYKERLF